MHSSSTYLMGLVGSGVAPSLTPPMHMAEAAEHGVPLVYRPIDLEECALTPSDLPEILDWTQRLGFNALNVSHPVKQSVIPHLDRLDPVARALGAVNTVVFEGGQRVGYNTDTTGFARGFRAGLPGADLRDVVVLGAGGAGSAVADALVRLGAERLTIVDMDARRAAELAGDIADRHGRNTQVGTLTELASSLASASGVVNCTPIGMHHHPGSPVDPALLHDGLWVADIVYRPLETELLAAARAAGCRTLHGGHMAVGQAADTFKIVTGREADAERMRQHFHRLIEAEEAPTHQRPKEAA